jgi:non-ribosomal peptide synthetase component F
LSHQGIKLWSEKGRLNAFVPKGKSLSDFDKVKIKENKDNILNILELNGVNSSESKYMILKTSDISAPLSFAQERLWFLEQYESGTGAYNIPLVFELNSSTDLSLLEKSIKYFIERHEIMRTFLKINCNGDAYQVVNELDACNFKFENCKVKSYSQLHDMLEKDSLYSFNLSEEFPIKITFYSLIDKKLFLSLVVHHVAFDGWSIDILIKEIQQYYFSHLNHNNDNSFSKVSSIQYKDFALWQRFYLSGNRLESEISFWRSKLNGYEPLNLPLDKARPSQICYEGNDVYFKLDESASKNLRSLAKSLNVSLYSLLLSAYYLLLSVYSNQNDIVLGTPVASRNYPQLENLVGFFVNSLVLRTQINSTDRLIEFIKRVGKEVIDAQVHQSLPFERLVEELSLEKDTSKHPIFQIMFGVQSFGVQESNSEQIFNLYHSGKDYHPAKFDITTMIDDGKACLQGSFNYSVSLFSESTIQDYVETYKKILLQFSVLTATSQKTISDLDYISENEEEKQLTLWNSTDVVYPKEKLIHQLFDEASKQFPDNIALVDDKSSITYSELSRQVDFLSKYILLERNLTFNDDSKLIAILSEKGSVQAISALSIMKAGYAYLPLNVDWPINRIEEVLKSGMVSTVLISKKQYDHYLSENSLLSEYKYIVVEDSLKLSSEKNFISKINDFSLPEIISDDVAYVIFTSGSTGKPKGVTISHQGAVNTIFAINEEFDISEKDKILALSELSFDLSVYDIFGLLASGGTVVFPNQSNIKNPTNWIDLINKYGITIWNSVPQLAGLLVDEAAQISKSINSLRLFLLSGDWIPLNLPSSLKAISEKVQVISLGGATEGSIWSIWYPIKEVDSSWKSIPYGLAMPNQKMYILNHSDKLCPVGAIGEIHIGGDGVALNYWGDAEKNKSQFLLSC